MTNPFSLRMQFLFILKSLFPFEATPMSFAPSIPNLDPKIETKCLNMKACFKTKRAKKVRRGKGFGNGSQYLTCLHNCMSKLYPKHFLIFIKGMRLTRLFARLI